jgi:hypothetical protein
MKAKKPTIAMTNRNPIRVMPDCFDFIVPSLCRLYGVPFCD